VEGRSAAVPIVHGRGAALRGLAERPYLVVTAIWTAWAGAVVATVAIGMSAGVYDRSKEGVVGAPLFPFFSWDFGWYNAIAQHGYPPVADRFYAFFPLWPWLLRAAGSVPSWQLAGAVTVAASGLAFLGVAAGSPAGRPREAAVALACWPGSFALLLAYPDGLALAAAAWAAALFVRERPLAAAPLGAAAAMLRPNGLLIALPLALLSRGRDWRFKLAAAAPVAAALAVEIFFWDRSGRFNAFFHAQRLWGRSGPSGIGKWADHVGSLFVDHTAVISLALVIGCFLVVFAWRRFGLVPTVIVAYVCAVPVLLAATQSLQGFADTARCVLVLPLLVVLWRMGPRYRPWTLFAGVVVAALLSSGLMHSFGRQSLYAFPIFWAIGEGPSWLRKPPLLALGFAANLGLALLITRFAP